jgi:negative regulator of replication initiation
VKLLPLELLESDDEDDVPQQDSAADSNRKRRKLGAAEQALLREPKQPKDKRLGSTAYRVVKPTGDARLAPKVKKQAVNLKETLLRRERVPVRKGGFFVKSR